MYNIKVFYYKQGIIYLLILFFILIMYASPSIEGFNAGDITGIVGTVNNIARDASSIPGKITAIGSQIAGAATNITNTVNSKIGEAESRVAAGVQRTVDDAIKPIATNIENVEQKIMNQVEGKINAVKQTIKSDLIDPISGLIDKATKRIDNIVDQLEGIPQLIKDQIKDKMEWVLGKIKQLGENIGNVITGGIVDPFKLLFVAIGNVFVQLFYILMKIGNKIKSLPGCSVLYMFQSVFATINAIYKYFMPGFLVSFFSTIYAYTLKIPLEYISSLFGLDDWWTKCFAFDVNKQIKSIKTKFNDANKEFKSTFGHMDFKELIDFSN